MFPGLGSQILNELNSPEDFHVMEVENLSRQGDFDGFSAKSKRQCGTYSATKKLLVGLVNAGGGLCFVFGRGCGTIRGWVLGTLVAMQWSEHHVQITVS
jgi:hypothetical protein